MKQLTFLLTFLLFFLPELLFSQHDHTKTIREAQKKVQQLKKSLPPALPTLSEEVYKLYKPTLQSGDWKSPATWGGNLPLPSEPVVIRHQIEITGTVSHSKNIVVGRGAELIMKDGSFLQFTGVNEGAFVGSGMEVVHTDIGLWVHGKVNLQGSYKTSWTNAKTGLVKGATTFEVGNIINWKIGDDIAIAPTKANDFTFEDRKITAVNGNIITINSPLTNDHPQINNRWTAEILNLTRGVRIEGTAGGHSHIFIMSERPQIIKYVQLRFMGPRKDINADGIKEFVLGRYGVHFHHSMDGSRGSIVEGCIVRDTDSHSFVPHVSHGITFKNCVAYNVTEIAYWTDPGHTTNDIVFDSCGAANVKYLPGSKDVGGTEDPNENMPPTLSSSGFKLGVGSGNKCNNSWAVAAGMGDINDGGGFRWMANDEGPWEFRNCLSHNNHNGLIWWQISSIFHVNENWNSYNNIQGGFHGAYANMVRYVNGYHYNSPFDEKASAINTARIRFENVTFDGAGVVDYPFTSSNAQLQGTLPILMVNCTIKGGKLGAIHDYGGSFIFDAEYYKSLDLVGCDIQGAIKLESVVAAFEQIRVQPKTGQAYKITKTGTTNIADFAPKIWGTGTGLNVVVFTKPNFTDTAFTRIDPYVSFEEWYNPDYQNINVHPSIAPDNFTFSVRWTGKLQPQFTESYRFILGASGTHKLTIGTTVVVNNNQQGSINLVAGQLYDIKIEFTNDPAMNRALNFGGVGLYWQSASLDKFGLSWDGTKFVNSPEFVPQSQLYASAVIPPPPPPPPPPVDENKPPVVSAGSDITITLPTNTTALNGTANDPEGKPLTYSWSKTSGGSATIATPSAANTTISGLVEGVYIFKLTATDDKGLTASDEITVTIKKEIPPPPDENKPPTANAGPDMSIVLPTNSLNLVGSGTDPEGKPLIYKWEKTIGPQAANILIPNQSSTIVNSLVEGIYNFRLTVTDDKGLTATDEVTITVKPQPPPPPVDIKLALPFVIITSPTVQAYTITTSTGRVLKNGSLAIGENKISVSEFNYVEVRIKVGTKIFRVYK